VRERNQATIGGFHFHVKHVIQASEWRSLAASCELRVFAGVSSRRACRIETSFAQYPPRRAHLFTLSKGRE